MPIPVEVEYDPVDPSISRIKGNGSQSIAEWLGLEIGLGGLILLVFMLPGLSLLRSSHVLPIIGTVPQRLPDTFGRRVRARARALRRDKFRERVPSLIIPFIVGILVNIGALTWASTRGCIAIAVLTAACWWTWWYLDSIWRAAREMDEEAGLKLFALEARVAIRAEHERVGLHLRACKFHAVGVDRTAADLLEAMVGKHRPSFTEQEVYELTPRIFGQQAHWKGSAVTHEAMLELLQRERCIARSAPSFSHPIQLDQLGRDVAQWLRENPPN